MKTNKKSLSIVLFALVAVIVLGIGYATINAINLTITGNATASPDQANFTVAFMGDVGETKNIEYKEILKQFNTETGLYVDNEVDYTNNPNKPAIVDSDLAAHFTTQQLTGKDEKAVATYRIKNTSPDLKADLAISCSCTNTEYFQTTCKLGSGGASATLNPGAVTTVTVEVTVLKTPIGDTNPTSTVSTIITATPNNN